MSEAVEKQLERPYLSLVTHLRDLPAVRKSWIIRPFSRKPWARRPHETEDPSRVPNRHRHLQLRQLVGHAFYVDARRLARGSVLAMPPLLHRQAEDRGYRRTRRALPPEICPRLQAGGEDPGVRARLPRTKEQPLAALFLSVESMGTMGAMVAMVLPPFPSRPSYFLRGHRVGAFGVESSADHASA